MKRLLIIKLSVFVVVMMAIATVFDWMISTGLKKTERYAFHTMNALMGKDSINADVVVLGNSRTMNSYHPCVLDTILDVYTQNLGISGQPYGVSHLRWQLYRRHNKKPKLLVVNMDYAELKMVTNGFEREQYYPYIKDTLVKPYLDLYGFSWMEKNFPMYRYRGDYQLMAVGLSELFHIHHDTKGGYIKGYSNSDFAWEGDGLKTMLKNGMIKGACNPEAISLLENDLEEAKADGIPVVFVYAPIYKELKDNLDETMSMEVYQQLSEKCGIPILDYSRMAICGDTAYFHNANHVNSAGAVVFTVDLAHKLDSIGLLKK